MSNVDLLPTKMYKIYFGNVCTGSLKLVWRYFKIMMADPRSEDRRSADSGVNRN